MEALALANQPKYILEKRQRLIQPLAVQLKNARGKPVDAERIQQLEAFLEYLDTRTAMTPQLRAATHIDKGLQLITNPQFLFPPAAVARAARLLEKWEAANWGKQPGDDNGGDGDTTDAPPPGGGGTPASDVADARAPPPDHPIFGEQGIMHGVLMVRKPATANTRRTVFYRRNPAYAARNARVFGHNGLTVGDWWPMQIVALVRGAHGSSQGGIAGDAAHGAYSIVVAGTYDDLDKDEGDVIWYAGSRQTPTPGIAAPEKKSTFTLALHTSARLRQPIRVLRSASAGNGASVWAPSVGLRYDGLYRITQVQRINDGRGGEIDRFRLQREPGQPALATYVRSVPSAAQKEAFSRIQEGY